MGEARNRANRSKHGIPFEGARAASLDENARIVPDPDHSDDESHTIEYFKGLAEPRGIPYQNLINLYLRECAESEKNFVATVHRPRTEER